MSAIRLFDEFDSDRRVENLSAEAGWLWVRSATYAARYRTDAFVDDAWFKRRVTSTKKRARIAAELEREGLWDRREGGWVIGPALVRDYSDRLIRIETELETRRRRANDAERQARKREQEAAGKPSREPSVTQPSRRDSRWSTGKAGLGEEGKGSRGTAIRGAEESGFDLTEAERADPDELEAELDRLRRKFPEATR